MKHGQKKELSSITTSGYRAKISFVNNLIP
jgi:hypothetical protein